MANSKTDTQFTAYANVDTTPGASGYWTTGVCMRDEQVQKMWFSIRGTSTSVVTLQFKCEGDADWSINEEISTSGRKLIEGGGAYVYWRAGIANDTDYVDEVTFGFDW